MDEKTKINDLKLDKKKEEKIKGVVIFVCILLAFGFLFPAIIVSDTKNAQVDYITTEIPDVIRVTKENMDDVKYQDNKDMDIYTVTAKDKTYQVLINKDKSGFKTDVRELTSAKEVN